VIERIDTDFHQWYHYIPKEHILISFLNKIKFINKEFKMTNKFYQNQKRM